MGTQQSTPKEYVYVHAGTNVEFADYQKQHLEYHCVLIQSSETLRARTPGKIARTGTYRTKWNHQDIEEGIDRVEHKWGLKEELPPTKEGDEGIYDYGIN